MPSHHGPRPLKAWRYVGVYGSELMLCAAIVRIGAARQSFWAVWDRRNRLLLERTRRGAAGEVSLAYGRLSVTASDMQAEIALEEAPGIETVCRSGTSYAWTRKQGGITAHGVLTARGERRPIDARAVVDDTAGYYQRHTQWRWSAGVGTVVGGRQVAWNLVDGVNDPPSSSERTIWVAGEPLEPSPSTFAPDLSRIDGLEFRAEATRQRAENLLLVRSRYRQPFGTFSGALAGVGELLEGYGVMEEHDVWW